MPQCITAKKKDYTEVCWAGKSAQWVSVRVCVHLCVCVDLGLLGGFLNEAQGAIWAQGGERE